MGVERQKEPIFRSRLTFYSCDQQSPAPVKDEIFGWADAGSSCKLFGPEIRYLQFAAPVFSQVHQDTFNFQVGIPDLFFVLISLHPD